MMRNIGEISKGNLQAKAYEMLSQLLEAKAEIATINSGFDCYIDKCRELERRIDKNVGESQRMKNMLEMASEYCECTKSEIIDAIAYDLKEKLEDTKNYEMAWQMSV